MRHFASPGFWFCYRQLPPEIRESADRSFERLRHDPHHPSLRLKKVGEFWSARVGLRYRALARDRAEGLVWFWIGSHADYDALLKQSALPGWHAVRKIQVAVTSPNGVTCTAGLPLLKSFP